MSTLNQQVYWSIFCESNWGGVPVQHIIRCHNDATFDQLLEEVKRVTSKNRVISFSYALNNRLNNIIINDNKSLKLVMKVIGERAFDIREGGISIQLNESPRYITVTCSILCTLIVYTWLLLWFIGFFNYSFEHRTYIMGKDKYLIIPEYIPKN